MSNANTLIKYFVILGFTLEDFTKNTHAHHCFGIKFIIMFNPTLLFLDFVQSLQHSKYDTILAGGCIC